MSTKSTSASKQHRETRGEQARLSSQKPADADDISQWLCCVPMSYVTVFIVWQCAFTSHGATATVEIPWNNIILKGVTYDGTIRHHMKNPLFNYTFFLEKTHHIWKWYGHTLFCSVQRAGNMFGHCSFSDQILFIALKCCRVYSDTQSMCV